MEESTILANEILARADTLATTLGVTISHLWEMLVTQGFLLGVVQLAIHLTSVIIMSVIAYFLYRKYKDVDMYDDAAPALFMYAILFVCNILMFVAMLSTYILNIVNPEAYAFAQIAGAF